MSRKMKQSIVKSKALHKARSDKKTRLMLDCLHVPKMVANQQHKTNHVPFLRKLPYTMCLTVTLKDGIQ